MTGTPPPGVPGLEHGRAGLVEADEGREPEVAREIAAAVTKSKKVSETHAINALPQWPQDPGITK